MKNNFHCYTNRNDKKYKYLSIMNNNKSLFVKEMTKTASAAILHSFSRGSGYKVESFQSMVNSTQWQIASKSVISSYTFINYQWSSKKLKGVPIYYSIHWHLGLWIISDFVSRKVPFLQFLFHISMIVIADLFFFTCWIFCYPKYSQFSSFYGTSTTLFFSFLYCSKFTLLTIFIVSYSIPSFDSKISSPISVPILISSFFFRNHNSFHTRHYTDYHILVMHSSYVPVPLTILHSLFYSFYNFLFASSFWSNRSLPKFCPHDIIIFPLFFLFTTYISYKRARA